MAKDFRNKQFGRIIRGYSPEEVDEYIGYINDEYRKLERRCADSERKLALALKKLDEMHRKYMGADNAENELAAAAVSEAKDAADRIIADANTRAAEITEAAEQEAAEKARVILEEAAKGAEEIITSAETEAADNKKTAESLFAAAEKMYGEVCTFRDSLFAIYNTHIESIEHVTEEAERAMGVIENAFEAAVPEQEEAEEAEPEIEVEIEVLEDAPEEETGDDEPEYGEEEPAEAAQDLYIDLGELEEDGDEEEARDSMFAQEEDEEEYADESEDDGCDEDDSDYAEDDYDDLTEADEFLVDWNSCQSDEDDDGYEDDGEESGEDESDEDDAQEAFDGLDDMFSETETEELSLTDEFDLVFNAANAKKNVELIRKQPTVAPEKPKNPKKHQKF